jgi:hypothetical protein
VDENGYGLLVERTRRGKTEVVRGNPVPVSHFPRQISYGLTDSGYNPGLRGERPAIKRLSHDTALKKRKFT